MTASSLYLPRLSPLHSAHPLTKVTLAALILVAGIALPDLTWLLGAFVIWVLPLMGLAKLLPQFLSRAAKILWSFLLSLSIIQGFFTPGVSPLFELGPYVFTQEGFLAGLEVAARLLLALSGTLLLMLTTRPDALMLALRQRGLPDALSYIVLTALQIFPRFQARAQQISEAQQARGLETQVSFFRRFALLLPLTAPLVLGSVVDVEERAMALEARAFSRRGPKTNWLTLEDTRAQSILRVAFGLAMIALLLWRIGLL